MLAPATFSTMQTSRNVGQENATIQLITIYLLGVLTWTLIVIAANIFNLLLTRVDNEPRKEDDEMDRLEGNYVPCGKQFLASVPVRTESKNRLSNCIDFKNNYDDSTSVEMIRSNFDNETIIDEPLNDNYEDTNRKISFHAKLDKGGNNAAISVEGGSNLRKVHFALTMDQSKEQFANNVSTVSRLISNDSNDENGARNVCDRENVGTTSNNNQVRPMNESFETNITENTDSTVRRALTATFLTSVFQESNLFNANSREPLDQKTTPMETSVSEETHIALNAKGMDENDSDIFVELEELLNRSNDDNKVPPQNEHDHPEELVGVVTEKESNSMAEESVIHSSMVEAQSRIEEGTVEKKEEEEVGPPPERKPLKNGRGAESTILLSRAQSTGYGKEEEDLNAMIRRMIISELKRHCKKKQMVLKRAYSDTESVMPSKRHSSKTRTGLFSLKGRTFFRDLLELEESMRKKVDNGSESEAAVARIGQKTSNLVQSTRRDGNVMVDAVPNMGRARDSINSLGTMCNFDSDILLERKVSVHCLPEAPESIENGNVPAGQYQIQASKSTQTEHVYVIHAIRSCPLRKGRPLLHFQLHRLATGREPASSKTVFANLDYTRFVFRKASDNLIYEKGKASGSPSYIPNPERFHWKYVMPNTAK